MKKLLSLLLVLAMVLGMGTAAFAAYPDSTGNKYEASILKVSQLGVFEGTDGKFNPNATITRAEFAAVMVRTLGLESAALALTGTPTKFTDVPASHWASGYVNIAVAKGLSTGTSATTFSPSAPVTHAEVITMLVRGMNRDSQAVGTWPVGHIMVASQLNLMSGLTFGMNVPALRSEVAKYIDNSLAKAHLVLNSEGVLEEESDVTYLALLDSTVVTGVVSAVSTTNGTITIPAGTKYLATGAEIYGSTLANLKGQNVQLTLNSDDEIMFAKLYTTSQIVGKVTATDSVAKTVTVNGTTYVMLNTASVTVNGTIVSGDALAKIAAVKGADVVMVLDDAGKVSYVTGTLLSATEEKITGKSTAVDNGKIYTVITLATSGAKKIDSTTTIVRNGVAAVAADLKIGDFVKFAEASAVLTYVDAFGTTVTGVIAEKTTVNGFGKIKIGTTTYDVALDSYGDPDTTADTAYDSFNVGAYVTLTLDRTGKFSNVVAATGNTQLRTIAGTSIAFTATAGTSYTVSTTDGGVYTLNTGVGFFVDPEAAGGLLQLNCVNAKFSDLAAGQQVIFKFDGNGKIVALDAFSAGPITASGVAGAVISGTDADSIAYALTTNGSTAVTINNLPGVVGSVAANASVSFTWDFTSWDATNHTNALVSSVNAKSFDVTRGAIVGVSFDGTNYQIVVRTVGSTDTIYNVTSTSKLTIDGVTGKAWSDLAVGQKINLVAAGAPTATISFAEVTADTTAPSFSSVTSTATLIKGKLTEDAMATVKIYSNTGSLLYTCDTYKVARSTASGNTLITIADLDVAGVDLALAAGSTYSFVITAVDAAGNATAAPTQVTVVK